MDNNGFDGFSCILGFFLGIIMLGILVIVFGRCAPEDSKSVDVCLNSGEYKIDTVKVYNNNHLEDIHYKFVKIK